MQAKSRIWVQLSILLYAVILGAVTFLSVLPNLQEADNAKAQTVQVQQENSLHEQRLRQLEQEFLDIEELQAELAALQLELPLQPELPLYMMLLEEAARQTQVQLSSITMSEPRRFSSEATLENPVAGGTTIELPFSLTVIGNPARLYDFVKTLQYAERIVTIGYWQVDPNSSSLNLNGVIYLVTNSLEEVDHRSGRIFDEIAKLTSSADSSETSDADAAQSEE